LYLESDGSLDSVKKLVIPDAHILFAGSAIANIGDIDSNGVDDLAISAQEKGATITDGFLPRVLITRLDTDNSILDYHIIGDDIDGIAGLQAGQWFGKSLASLPDNHIAVGIP